MMTCNRIIVKEIHSNNLANHHFQIKMEVKDVDIEELHTKNVQPGFL